MFVKNNLRLIQRNLYCYYSSARRKKIFRSNFCFFSFVSLLILTIVMNVSTSSPVVLGPTDIQNLSNFRNQTMPTSNLYLRYTEPDWIVPITINSFMIVITVWILSSLFHYGIKTGKWRSLGRESAADLLNKGAVYTSVIVCGVSTLFYHIVAGVYLNTGFDESNFSHKLCDTMADLCYIAYAVVLFSVALFLWLRQRAFYNNPMISVHYSKFAKIVSLVSFGVILFGGIGILVFNIYPSDHKSSVVGCVYVPDANLKFAYWLSVTALVILAQGVLVGLFVYALKMIRKPGFKASSSCDPDEVSGKSTIADESEVQGSRVTTSTKISKANSSKSFRKPLSSTSSSTSNKDRIRAIILKTFIFAIISTLMDVFTQIVIGYITKPHDHRRYVVTMVSTSALFNFLFVILSFNSYRSMLISPCKSLSSSCEFLYCFRG